VGTAGGRIPGVTNWTTWPQQQQRTEKKKQVLKIKHLITFRAEISSSVYFCPFSQT